jgi:Domain of unknown function (DUF4397)
MTEKLYNSLPIVQKYTRIHKDCLCVAHVGTKALGRKSYWKETYQNRRINAMRKLTMIVATIVALMAVFATPAAASPGQTHVYVVHGIPGKDLGLASNDLPVDIKVGGACALKGFTFGSIAGPVALPAGNYLVEISLANSTSPCSNTSVIAERVVLGRSESASIVAHLRVNGSITLTKFTNQVGFVGNNTRLQARHTANAPRVDIKVNGVTNPAIAATFPNIANAQVQFGGVLATIPAGEYSVGIFAAGTNTAVFGPATLNLKPRTVYLAFAVGSLQNDTFRVLIKDIPAAF